MQKISKMFRRSIALILAISLLLPSYASAQSLSGKSMEEALAELVGTYEGTIEGYTPFKMTSSPMAAKRAAVDFLNNEYRIPNGYSSVVLDEGLCKYADMRAKEEFFSKYVDRMNFVPHMNIAGTYTDLLAPQGSIISRCGENSIDEYYYIAEGEWDNSTIESALKDQFYCYTFSTEGHYENMLYSKDTHCGIGYYIVPNANYAFVVYIGSSY